MSGKPPEFQAPLMSAFRESFAARDSGRRSVRVVDGERILPGRRPHQRGGDEGALKRDLTVDLVGLLNTVDLGSAVDLSEFDHVRRSILNYGLRDISHLTTDEVGVDAIRADLLIALTTYEPRINPETLQIEREDLPDDVNQRIRFSVSAEMLCAPTDVPIDFVAEIEIGSGKLHLSRLPTAA